MATDHPDTTIDAECEIHTAVGEPHTAYISGDDYERIPIKYIVHDGWAITEGDIVLGRAEAVAEASRQVAEYLDRIASGERGLFAPLGSIVSGQHRRWPGGRIPYVIDREFPNRARIDRAIRHWHEVTPVRLEPRMDQDDAYVHFTSDTICSSSVGRVGRRQYIRIASGCGWAAVVHEIGHAFGLHHEHLRKDRDKYIEIHEANIKPRALDNFTPPRGNAVGPYNHGSVMHYSSHAFSRNGKATITTRPPDIPIGRRGELTAGDLQAVGLLLAGPNSDTPALGHYVATTLNRAHPNTGMTYWYFSGRHRLFVRVRGGDASLPQRCLIYMRSGHQTGTPIGSPDLILGGGRPVPDHWYALPLQSSKMTYYIGGQHNSDGWKWDTGVHVRREQHENAIYYAFGFNDVPGDTDYNDYVVEVAVVVNLAAAVDVEFPPLVDVSPEEAELSTLAHGVT